MANLQRERILKGKLGWLDDNTLSDVGIYQEAEKGGHTFSEYLETLKAQKEDSKYVGMTKQEVLAEKKNIQKETGLPAPLTAFEETLKAAGIAAFGSYTDPVRKFFEYSDTEILFPEYVSDRVYAGLLAASLVPTLAMRSITIDSTTYHKTYISDTETDRDLGESIPGEDLPETKIIVSRQSIYLTPYGRYLTTTYDDVEFVKLNVFDIALQRIGMNIGIRQTDEMIYVLINGDGNSNTPATTVQTATSGTIATADVINWATGLPTPYKMSDFIGRKALLAEYFTTLVGLNNPFNQYNLPGVDLPMAHEWDRSVVTTDYFIGIDKRYAIEHITTGGVRTETEKLVRKQLNGTAITHRDAFAIFDNNAVAIFDETHA